MPAACSRFPVHPVQETLKRPTAALDRNLQYLSLVEVLHGYPLDGVVLTMGCDKTTPAQLMGAATVNIPAIGLSGGPMLDGWWKGRLAGSGTIVWEARKMLAAGEIDNDTFIEMVAASATSVGHCSTMGTALSMNSLAEAVGMSLTGCAAIPGPYRQRGQIAYETGRRIVEMVEANLRPSDIMTKKAFENAVAVASAIGASSNCPVHMVAIARHMGVDHTVEDWQRVGADIPLLVDCQPAGRYLGEAFYRAGGIPAVMKQLLDAGLLHGDVMTVTGKTVAENLAAVPAPDPEVIRPLSKPMKERAGFVVLSGNLFDNAVMKISVIDKAFRERFLSDPPDVFEGKVAVFEGPRGLPRAHRGPGFRHRRQDRAGHPQLRPRGLSGRGGGGEHAAARVAVEARHHRAADHGRRAAIGHVRIALDPERLAGSRGRRGARVAARWRSDPHRPQHPQGGCADPGGGTRRGGAPPGRSRNCSTRRRGRRSTGTPWAAWAPAAASNPPRCTSTSWRRAAKAGTITDMTARLAGKRCFVTAGRPGIGRAAALAMAAEGAIVIATDRDAHKVGDLGARGITHLALDVLDDAAVERAREGSRPDRRAVQLRRLRPPEQRRHLHGRGLGFRLRAERARHV